MKQKLLNALKEGYKNLGLAESAFERVAAFGETFITSDEQIESFVKAAEAMLKAEQSAADKVRTELNAKIKGLEGEKADLEAKLNGNNPPEPNPEPKPHDTSDIAAIVAQAVAAAINPLQEKLNAFETAQSQKSAVAALDELKATWDYAKGYPTECEDAYERVMELYEVGGKKWTADELTGKFKEKFNKAVSKKGVDTTKPFQSDGGAGASEAEKNAAFAAEIRNALGIKGE
jgi:hypothetical protein